MLGAGVSRRRRASLVEFQAATALMLPLLLLLPRQLRLLLLLLPHARLRRACCSPFARSNAASTTLMTTLCHGPLLVLRWFASPFFSHRIRCCAATSDHAGKSCTLWSTSACAVSRSVTDLPVAVDDVVDPKEQGFLAAGGPIGTPEFIKAHVQLRGACARVGP